MKLAIKKASSLEKVFLDREPIETNNLVNSIFKNEKFSFQAAFCGEEPGSNKYPFLQVVAENNYGGRVRIRSVGNVPCELPSYQAYENYDYIQTTPGLFPDPLYDLEDEKVKVVFYQWRSIWIDFTPDEQFEAGIYNIIVKFLDNDGNEVGRVSHDIEVIDAMLPKQELIYTDWFHYDCLAVHYKVDVFSEKHWELIKKYIKTAVDNGVNMILTPLFTPPLDTKVGSERPTVQLIDVKVQDGKYIFGFDRLHKFIDMCLNIGVEYFEMSHLFTQWGAAAAPKIIAEVDGVEKRIFGWETVSTGEEYSGFLKLFLSELTNQLRAWGIADRCWFHLSDEPKLDHLENYTAAKNIVKECLKDFRIMDALSNYEFYKMGLVSIPIPSTNHLEPFLEAGIEGLWTYYCCGQHQLVSNRFFSMPSRRTRILGVQLYKYDIVGFLHWGYNFWFTQYSIKAINPYFVTDAGCAFQGGDAFVVYPGDDGNPVESLRLLVFKEGLDDLRAMEMLESLTSKDYVMSIIEEGGNNITFTDYPRQDEYLINLRNRINFEIKKFI